MASNKTTFVANPVRLERLSRSKLDLSHKRWMNLNTGYVVPIFSYGDVLPGDTFKVSLNGVIRGSDPKKATMDYAVCEVYFFFVPHKMTLSREMMSPSLEDSQRSFKAFIGAQDSLLNMPLPSDIKLPVINFAQLSVSGDIVAKAPFELNSLADYLAMPTLKSTYTGTIDATISDDPAVINVLEPLAYYCTWNNYFRDPNTMNPVTYSIGDESGYTEGVVLYNDFFKRTLGDLGVDGLFTIGDKSSILPASRFHGYFGSALPWPQRNSEAITLPLGGIAPVYTSSEDLVTGRQSALQVRFANSGSVVSRSSGLATNSGGQVNIDPNSTPTSPTALSLIYPSNLYANLDSATSVTVNQLRFSVQAQRWYEALARGGNRIGELTRAMFDVTPHDMADDRPEFLGYQRFELGTTQVENTAGELGDVGGFSLNSIGGSFFTKSFDTWGTILGVMVIRVEDSFHQGLAKRYSRRNRFDFYWPQFANIGEQPVLKKEIYFQGSSADNQVFGYQEAWADYRFWPNEVTGLARPGFSDNSLDMWTYVNDFASAPTLKGFLDASKQVSNVDRTLKTTAETAGFQWFGNIYFDVEAIRPMPLYSVPGLVDHH